MALETILVAVGPGDANRAEEMAQTSIDIAGPSGARIVLTHVFTRDQYDETVERLNVADGAEVSPNEVASQHATIHTIAERLDENGIRYEIRGSVGEHDEEIISIATETKSDLIIVGGRERSPTGKAVFGSTAQKVLLSAPCPVTFVKGK
ncbi:universal stress protein [Halobellus rarus]|uniref:Universal stress protein n=1 Tax=Halobellus rarus TaxID=1126237 RepID=A0ABD6CND4_9EURY|nr:universal stress protein [Halobellus rarus]